MIRLRLPQADRHEIVGVLPLDLLGARHRGRRIGELVAVVGHGAVNANAVGQGNGGRHGATVAQNFAGTNSAGTRRPKSDKEAQAA